MNTKGILIWQNEDFSQFYLSNFDQYTNSFLDEYKIIELMNIITRDEAGRLGPCYSLLYPNINMDGLQLDKLIDMPYTTPLKLNLLSGYDYFEYDVLLTNNLRARTIIGGDIYLENSKKMKNFLLLKQQLNVTLNLDKLEPNRLYILADNKLNPTNIKTTRIADFLIKNDQLIYDITNVDFTGDEPRPSPVVKIVTDLT
jgi:hypothetical protein